MINYYKNIKLFSKNRQSLERFITFLKSTCSKWKTCKLAFNSVKKKRQKLAILKSPHVNKKAQEQFQSITYSINIKYWSWQAKKNLILLKKIKNHIFPDVKMKIEQTIFIKKTTTLINKDSFLPKKTYYYTTKTSSNQLKKNLTVFSVQPRKKITLKKTLQFLKLLDSYGNIV